MLLWIVVAIPVFTNSVNVLVEFSKNLCIDIFQYAELLSFSKRTGYSIVFEEACVYVLYSCRTHLLHKRKASLLWQKPLLVESSEKVGVKIVTKGAAEIVETRPQIWSQSHKAL